MSSAEKFSIDAEEQKKAKGKSSGSALIEVYVDGDHHHNIRTENVFGTSAWTRIVHSDGEEVFIRYARELTDGHHVIDAQGHLSYTDRDGNSHYSATGKIIVDVSDSGTTQAGQLDATYSNAQPTIQLKGTYNVKL